MCYRKNQEQMMALISTRRFKTSCIVIIMNSIYKTFFKRQIYLKMFNLHLVITLSRRPHFYKLNSECTLQSQPSSNLPQHSLLGVIPLLMNNISTLFEIVYRFLLDSSTIKTYNSIIFFYDIAHWIHALDRMSLCRNGIDFIYKRRERYLRNFFKQVWMIFLWNLKIWSLKKFSTKMFYMLVLSVNGLSHKIHWDSEYLPTVTIDPILVS